MEVGSGSGPSQKKYAVVNFTTENEVELVASNWLFEENSKCYWPLLSGPRLNSNIRQCVIPATDSSWTVYENVIVLKFCGKFIIMDLTISNQEIIILFC
jgi:hypothetical protein